MEPTSTEKTINKLQHNNKPHPPALEKKPLTPREEKTETLLEYAKNYPPESSFPEKARNIISGVAEKRRKKWEQKMTQYREIPDDRIISLDGLNLGDFSPLAFEGIQTTIEQSLRDEVSKKYGYRFNEKLTYFQFDSKGLFRSFNSIWITEETFRQEIILAREFDNLLREISERPNLNRLKRDQLLYTAQAVDEYLIGLTEGHKKFLTNVRNRLSESNYLSHATKFAAQVIESGELSSRGRQETKRGYSNNTTGSHLKAPDQEANQVCFFLDGESKSHYAGFGKAFSNKNGYFHGLFLFPTLNLLTTEDVSFFDADGIHIFRKGTGFGVRLEHGKMITTSRELDILSGPKGPLSKVGKTHLQWLTLNYDGQPITDDDFDESSSLSPEAKAGVNKWLRGTVFSEFREKVKKSLFILPTGDFGDGPGLGDKKFQMRLYIPGVVFGKQLPDIE